MSDLPKGPPPASCPGLDRARRHCEHCPSTHNCSTLKLALTVLEQNLSRSSFAAHFAGITFKLRSFGWGYPFASDSCLLNKSPSAVKAITDDLIRLNRRSKINLIPNFETTLLEYSISNLYQEETRYE